MRPFKNPDVARAFEAYPAPVRKEMLALRELILATAACTAGVGEIEETLKWGEPAYLTSRSKSGSTVRIDWKKSRPGDYAMYFNCQTNLIETFRTLFPHEFQFEGNRALIFNIGSRVPKDAVAFCVSAALTNHLRKGGPNADPAKDSARLAKRSRRTPARETEVARKRMREIKYANS